MEHLTLKQKVLRIFFWTIIIYTLLSTTFVWVIQLGLVSRGSDSQTIERQDSALELDKVTFSKQFARDYLLWTKGKEQSRAERLRDYFVTEVDDQGSLNFTNIKWNSYPRFVDVMKIETHSQSVDKVTVFAETLMTGVDDSKEQKRVDRYLVLFLQKSHSSYLVSGVPRFIAPPFDTVKEESKLVARSIPRDPVDEVKRQEVEKFMNSFWKVYTTGDSSEISYFKKDEQDAKGLRGILRFEEIQSLKVYKSNEKYVVDCLIKLTDLSSLATVSYPYFFELVYSNNRWFVSKMDEGGK